MRFLQLRDLAELEYLQHFNLTELWLEGNPLCDLYDEYNYVQQVIKYCPKIEKLVIRETFIVVIFNVDFYRTVFCLDRTGFRRLGGISCATCRRTKS